MQIAADNAAIPEMVQPFWNNPPGTVHLIGDRLSGKTRTLVGILVAALRDGLTLPGVALLAWTAPGARAFTATATATVAELQGYPPDTPLADMVPGTAPELIGSVCTVIRANTDDTRELMTGEQRAEMAGEFLGLVKRVGELGESADDVTFLRRVRRQIDASVRLSIRARLDQHSLGDAYRAAVAAGERLPAPAFVEEVVDYYRDYRRQCGVIDLADLLGARLVPVDACALTLIDEAQGIPPLGLAALRRLLPRAALVLAGLQITGKPDLTLRLV